MTRIFVMAIVGFLSASMPTAAWAQPGTDIFLVLDTSGSMLGHCGATCQKCGTDTDCPDQHRCTGRRCAMLPELEAQTCRDRWKDVLPRAEEFVSGLADGASIQVYTFDANGAHAVPMRVGATTGAESRRAVVTQLHGLHPAARCTHLYDIAAEVLADIERLPAAAKRDRLLFILTDGDDDGSTSTGVELRARLLSVQKGIAWQIVAPRGALKDVCQGNPHCRALEDALGGEWKVTPSLDLPKAALSLEKGKDTAAGVLRLNVDSLELFPPAIGVEFRPESEETGRLLAYEGPRSLRPESGELPIAFRLRPDLASKRPDTLRGKLILSRQQGKVVPGWPVELPVEFTVSQANFGAKALSSRKYNVASGTPVTFPLPRDVFQLLTHVDGYQKIDWNALAAVTRDSRIPKPAVAGLTGDLTKADQVQFSVSGRCTLEERRQGSVQVTLADANRWFTLGTIDIPVDLGECGDDDSGGWLWLAGIFLLLALAAMAFALLRHPDLRQLHLAENGELGVRDRGVCLPNAPARWGRPLKHVPLGTLGSARELREAEGQSLLDLPVTISLEKGNVIVATAANPVFSVVVPKPDPLLGEQRLKRLVLGRLSGGRLVETPVFRVLQKGPMLRLADSRNGLDRKLFGDVEL